MKSKKASKKKILKLPVNQTLEEWAIINMILAFQIFDWGILITDVDKDDKVPGMIIGDKEFIRKAKKWVAQSQKKKQG